MSDESKTDAVSFADAQRQNAVEAAQALAQFVNNMGHSPDAFAEHLTRYEHKTLQQSSFALMLKCIYKWAEAYDQGSYDLRNEDTCKLCSQIVKAIGKNRGVRFI